MNQWKEMPVIGLDKMPADVVIYIRAKLRCRIPIAVYAAREKENIMKRFMSIAMALLLMLALLAGCGESKEEHPSVTEPSVSTTEATVESTEESTEASEPAADEESIPTETEEDDVVYEGDASSYYIDSVYAEQIDRYYTALSQQWDETTCMEQGVSALVAAYYEGNPMNNVGFTFMDLDWDGDWELIIGSVQDPLIFEVWALKDGEPEMLLQSGYHNRYYLQYAEEDNLWSVAYEAENGAANHAVYYLQMFDGVFEVSQGIIFDAVADEKNPWFMTYDLDWDVSNDDPVDEDLANAILEAGRRTYTTTEYFPYWLYR